MPSWWQSTAPRPATTPAASQARIEDTVTGKSVAVIGASAAEIAAIGAAVPNAKALERKDGALVYSKKYEDKIRAALEGVTKPVTRPPPTAFKNFTLSPGFNIVPIFRQN
jgi:hypothetical protein